ncbi:MAG: 4Fe-4S dicluster domain-containing protein [Anaerolineae bacterium]|nr:4Fe-4S dicluster domain-containing protein [Anaerolineae bacterium]
MSEDILSRLSNHPAGKDAHKCFSCGMCVAGCPVGYHEPQYNLVQNLWDAYYLDTLSETLWWCATCFTCQDRCPHDVRMVEIIFLLQQYYVERFGRPEFIDSLVKLVENSGYMGRITPGLNKKREKIGLPPLDTEIGAEIKKLLKASSQDGTQKSVAQIVRTKE